MLTAAKDALTSQAARAYVNNFLKHYGRVVELKIDSKHHRIEVVVQLKGESSDIGITIEKYRIEQKDGKKFIHVVASSATRPWLQAVLHDHLHGRGLEIPSWAASAL